jgi:hypothetical protein
MFMKTILSWFAATGMFILLTAAYQHSNTTLLPQNKVTTDAVRDITNGGATCMYTVTAQNGRFEHGVVVNTTGNPVLRGAGCLSFAGSFYDKSVAQYRSCSAIMRLKSKVRYYVKAYEKLMDGTVIYGGQIAFTTL